MRNRMLAPVLPATWVMTEFLRSHAPYETSGERWVRNIREGRGWMNEGVFVEDGAVAQADGDPGDCTGA